MRKTSENLTLFSEAHANFQAFRQARWSLVFRKNLTDSSPINNRWWILENTARQDYGVSILLLGSYAGGIPVFGKTCGVAPIRLMASSRKSSHTASKLTSNAKSTLHSNPKRIKSTAVPPPISHNTGSPFVPIEVPGLIIILPPQQVAEGAPVEL